MTTLINTPPREVIEAIENGTTTVIRSANIYEADGRTEWRPEGQEQVPLLVDGSVSVDANRAERRFLDSLVLSNNDGQIKVGVSGLWYNHIIKLRRGVRYAIPRRAPSIAIVEAESVDSAAEFRQMLTGMGFNRTDLKLDTLEYGQVTDYDIVASYMPNSKSLKPTVLADGYLAGKAILTVGIQSTGNEVPLISAGSSGDGLAFGIWPVSFDTPLVSGWSGETYSAAGTAYRLSAVRPTAVVVATLSNDTTYPTVVIEESDTGGRWFHYQPNTFGTNGKKLLSKAITWLQNYVPTKDWTTSLGEFMIDKLSEDNFPGTISVSGRDFTKKCLISKLEQSVTFPAGTPIEELIRDLGANAGLFKFKMLGRNDELTTAMELSRGTDRWSVMTQAASSINCQLYLDADGYLTQEEYSDPSTSPITAIFQTGSNGNIEKLSKLVHDGNLFNHVVVTSDNEAQTGSEVALPYFGEAKNENPDSPTSISQIGDRYTEYSSSFFSSDDQCKAFAQTLLKVYALESFEMNWSSFTYPWMEVGRIVQVLDPKRLSTDPTRYLLDTLNIPIGLGPMSGTGKRVTYVEPSQAA